MENQPGTVLPETENQETENQETVEIPLETQKALEEEQSPEEDYLSMPELDVMSDSPEKENHSSEAENPADKKIVPLEKKDDPKPLADSEPSPATLKLEEELKVLTKRFKDTQHSFHEVSEDRATLQRKVDALEQRAKDEDDWFSPENEKEKEDLKKELSETDKKVSTAKAETEKVKAEHEKAEQDLAITQWNKACEPLQKVHKDFDELTGFLNDAIDSEKGDPAIRAGWDKFCEKNPCTPETAYKFASTVYKVTHAGDQIVPKAKSPAKKVTGKAALDNMNSSMDSEDQNPTYKGDPYMAGLF